MGRQINFYLTGEDQRRLLATIDAAVGCALLCRNDRSPYGARAKLDDEPSDWAFAYLCAPRFVERVLSDLHAAAVDSPGTPAIEFMRPRLHGEDLRRGRFWYAPKYFSAGAMLQHPTEFVDWADRVFRIVRRDLVLHRGGDRIGAEALEMLDARRINLIT